MLQRSDKGIAIIIALLTILILSTLGAAIIFSTQAEITTTYNYRRLTQARYVAEAGAQNTINWLIYSPHAAPSSYADFDMNKSPVECASSSTNCTPGMSIVLSAMSGTTANYPDSAAQSDFSGLSKSVQVDVPVTYEVSATLQTMQVVSPIVGSTQVPLQSWLIHSRATLSDSHAQVEVTTTVERFGSPLLYAAFAASTGCSAINFSGAAITDSFDSSMGTYTATRQNNGGNVGSNGNINLNGVTINGSGSTPNSATPGSCSTPPIPGLTTSGGGTITGSMVTLPSGVSFTTPAFPNPVPPTTNQTLTSLTPGQYGNVTISGGTVHLSQGVYNINSLRLTGGANLIVDGPGPVVFNLSGAALPSSSTRVVDLSGGSLTNTINGKPSDFQIWYAGKNPIQLSGGTSSYGIVYAPSAAITTGGSDWYGAIVGSTVTDAGTNIHFDRSLATNLPNLVGNYHATSFNWSKF